MRVKRSRSCSKNEAMKTHALLWGICLLLVLLAPFQTHAQSRNSGPVNRKPPKVRFDSADRSLNIPLEIDNNIILMRVSVNGSKPLKFIFDTGASASMINSPRARELGLKSVGQASGNATGGPITVSIIKGVSLSVPGATVSNQTVYSMALPAPSGFEFDGIIGYDFIKEFVVEIDYQKKTMNLHSPRTYRYSGKGKVVPLLLTHRETPLVRTKIALEGRAPFEAKLELDTGGDGTIYINSPFVKRRALLTALPQAVGDVGRGAGGEYQRLLGSAKTVQVGPFILANPPVVLSLATEGSSASEDNDGLIGGEILRRFKLIIDYSRSRMILEPNSSFNDPFSVDG